MLNALSAFIPDTERIVTIEDPTELQLQQGHVVTLEARPARSKGKGEVTQRDLVRNSLRMRPDRIIVGEVRGAEAFDMLQAMNTGHEGSLATVHANTPRDALARIENMVMMAGFELPVKAIREQMQSAIHLVIQIARFPDGTRKVTTVAEVSGMEGQVVTMQDLFRFEQTGVDSDGRVLGELRTTGIRPRFTEKFQVSGIHLPVGPASQSRGHKWISLAAVAAFSVLATVVVTMFAFWGATAAGNANMRGRLEGLLVRHVGRRRLDAGRAAPVADAARA